jgi:hypothetical protein
MLSAQIAVLPSVHKALRRLVQTYHTAPELYYHINFALDTSLSDPAATIPTSTSCPHNT